MGKEGNWLTVILVHKIRIYPNNVQETHLRKACGVKRFAYNWALNESKKHYEETGKSLSGFELSKKLNVVKKDQFPWLYEFRRQLEYKALLSKSTIFVVDRFYPSTNTCNVCGNIQDLKLSQRTWICTFCKTKHDRNVNAAINLKTVALRYKDIINACGEESAGFND